MINTTLRPQYVGHMTDQCEVSLYEQHPLTFLHHSISGNRGVGKSCTLNQAVMWARERGWICLFVPQGYF